MGRLVRSIRMDLFSRFGRLGLIGHFCEGFRRLNWLSVLVNLISCNSARLFEVEVPCQPEGKRECDIQDYNCQSKRDPKLSSRTASLCPNATRAAPLPKTTRQTSSQTRPAQPRTLPAHRSRPSCTAARMGES